MKLVKGDNNNSDFGWIGRGVEVKGDIFFADRLQIDGRVTGKLTSESGTLIIGESGFLEAEIDVGVCVVHGEFKGNLVSKSRVEIHRTGRVHGDLITPVLVVDEGALFDGRVKMGQQADDQSLEEVPPEEDGQRKAKGA